MLIRVFEPGDLETLRRLTVEAFEGVSIDHNTEKRFGVIANKNWRWRKARQIDEDVRANPAGVFVAVADSSIVGYVTTHVDRDAGIGHIHNLAVAASARGLGLGRRLIEHALGYFRAQGLSHAKIETLEQNPVGQHLYPACGFVEVARQIHYVTEL